jgi:hypothetical protein
MKRPFKVLQMNRRIAAEVWGKLPRLLLASLQDLTITYGFSLGRGDLTCLDGRWYVTHAGLLRLASRRRCTGIQVEAVPDFCDIVVGRWICKAIVSLPNKSGTFVGYGDADPSNVSPLVRGAEMRVAETRAVNRALRKAYGIGLCSIEELGARDRDGKPAVAAGKRPPQSAAAKGNGNGNGNANGNVGSRVRDRICQLIRRYGLDPEAVKAYALEFCGTASLRDAPRARVEEFVDHLAEQAERDRDALLCQLNSYPRTEAKQEEPKAGAA